MTNINFEVPEELHKQFKIKSVKVGKDMKDILIDLIKEYVRRKEDAPNDSKT